MNESRRATPTLEYARPGPVAAGPGPRFRWGIPSLTISLFAAAFTLFVAAGQILRLRVSRNLDTGAGLELMMVVSFVALGCGIGGMFQRSGRTIALAGVLTSVLDVILIPAFVPL